HFGEFLEQHHGDGKIADRQHRGLLGMGRPFNLCIIPPVRPQAPTTTLFPLPRARRMSFLATLGLAKSTMTSKSDCSRAPSRVPRIGIWAGPMTMPPLYQSWGGIMEKSRGTGPYSFR